MIEMRHFKSRAQPDRAARPQGCYHDSVAQLIVRNLEDDIRDKLRAMAAEHGVSMEEEVRSILRAAALSGSTERPVELGSRFRERFRGARRGTDLDAADAERGPIEELRGQAAKAADLEP